MRFYLLLAAQISGWCARCHTDNAWIWGHTMWILNKGQWKYDIFGRIDDQWNLVLVIWEEAIGSNPESSNIPVYPNPDQRFWSFWRETSIERRLMKGFRDHFHLPFHPQSSFITNSFYNNTAEPAYSYIVDSRFLAIVEVNLVLFPYFSIP